MAGQIKCENYGNSTDFDPSNPCNQQTQFCAPSSCPQPGSPCPVTLSYPPCSPNNECTQPQQTPDDCGNYNGCCYQQPARTLPIWPNNNIFSSTAAIEKDTIYKRSYYGGCGDCRRTQPIMPRNSLRTECVPLEKCTVQKLSYMPPCPAGRTMAIIPRNADLRFKGAMYAMTSQKHDFVPKTYSKRMAIMPRGGICRVCDPLEKCTINKLSYLPVDICKNPPPRPLFPAVHYDRPTASMDSCTVQKLSYLPICLPPKEPIPWANPQRCPPPRYETQCTTYHLSYLPNCNTGRTLPIMPRVGLKCFGTDSGDGNTVYKLSYLPVDARCCRPMPILPSNSLYTPNAPLEQCTIQKLSYQPNNCIPRAQPIRPRNNGLKPSGPLFSMTTQKHDFVQKPFSRRGAIHPRGHICRASGPMERCTINRLSYLPVNVCENPRPCPIFPGTGIPRSDGSMEKCTTYKLSYPPNCIRPKEHLPWVPSTCYTRPTIPMEQCTIQKLSYGPPGTFSRCAPCNPIHSRPCDGGFPKAAIAL